MHSAPLGYGDEVGPGIHRQGVHRRFDKWSAGILHAGRQHGSFRGGNAMIRRIALVMAGLVMLPHTACAEAWNTYVNGLYGYTICYPPELLTAQPESDNGDGRSFAGVGGATLKVWGFYNTLDDTPGRTLEGLLPRLKGKEGSVTYRRDLPGAATLSGRNGKSIFYARALAVHDRLLVFTLVYPATHAGTYDPVAARLNRCFGATR